MDKEQFGAVPQEVKSREILEKEFNERNTESIKMLVAEAKADIEKRFPEADIVLETEGRYIPALYVDFHFDGTEMMHDFKELLGKHNLELGSYLGGDRNKGFLLYQKKVDGKENWRRFLHHPEAMSKKGLFAIEKIVSSGEADEIMRYAWKNAIDKENVFWNMYEAGYMLGVITKEEYECLDGQIYELSWGRNAHGARKLKEGE